MSLIVIESGGSKSSWIYESNGKVQSFETVGLHPNELTDEKISILSSTLSKHKFQTDSTIFFYGAGCESDSSKTIIENFFTSFGFKTPTVNTDLLGACIATWKSEPGVTAILGTGAIAAKYNGKKILQTASGLGYILGDEGSGFDIGKRLLKAYFYNELPTPINEAIEQHFQGKTSIIQHVYAPTGRKKVADLSFIVNKFKHTEVIQHLLTEAFDAFVTTALLPLGNQTEIKTVGSIAHHFKQELEKVLNAYNITCKKNLPSAHMVLFQFHRLD